MADEIIRTIYKMELEDSGLTKGIDSASESLRKFAIQQEQANKRLKENEAVLKSVADIVEKDRKALDSYSGSDTKHKKVLEANLKASTDQYTSLKKIVDDIRAGYERAKKAAEDFANISNKATNLQPPGGGRIPIPGQPTQILPPAPIIPPLTPETFNDFDLTEILEANKINFDKLRVAIEGAEAALESMNQESEAFKNLSPIVERGKKALADFDAAASKAGGSTSSLRSQIRQGREELVKMEQAGKANTKAYFDLEKQVARLTDAYGDQQQRIRILSSDTKLLDFGKGAITAATSAFQAYTAVSILAGDQSEELQKKTMQLFAAMQLLQSIEQLSNLTRREGVLATLAQAGAQSAYTAVVGASTGALAGFKVALAATGIGIALAAIAGLVIAYRSLGEASKEVAAQQKALTEIGAEAARSFASEVTHLQLIKNELNDLNNPQKERIKLAKEYNKTAEEGNKIDLKQIDNIKLVNSAIDTQIAKIKERAFARAAEVVIAQKAEEVFRIQSEIAAKAPVLDPTRGAATQRLQQEQRDLDQRANNLVAARAKILGIKPVSTNEILALSGLSDEQINAQAKNSDKLKILQDKTTRDQIRAIDQRRTQIASENVGINKELRTLFDDLSKAEQALDFSLKIGVPLIKPEDLFKPGDTKEIENVFAQKLRELQARLAEVTAKSFESEGTIRNQFAASLEKEIASLNELVKDKKLTGAQAEILIDLTTRINQVQLTEALDQFNKKVTDARNKLNEDLRVLQQQNTEDQIQLLQDEFERRKQIIDFNEREQLRDAEVNTAQRLAALEQQRNLIGEQAYQDAKNIIVQEGEDAQTNIIISASQQRQQLAQDSFKKSLDFFQNAINEIDLIDDQDSAKEVRALSDKFLKQQITFEQFQKQLEKIERDYAAKKRNRDLLIERGELDALNFKLTQIEDKTSEHYKELLRLRDQQAKRIAELEKTDAVKDAQDETTDDTTRRVSTLNDYVSAVGQLTDSIIQFWAKANEVESAALDRSIAIQERRVDAAQRIAERGNAQYLKAEQDRLTELQIARENAARRQLGIDAALQGSQLLVGITGAISRIAAVPFGAETIADIAIIVGALATGFALVKSLQGNQPTFFVGTKDTGAGKRTDRDGFQAILHPHEAVIPADKNKAYKPTVSAIYDGTIPPEVINEYVKNYHHNKTYNSKTVNEFIKNYYDSKVSTENLKKVNSFITNNYEVKQIPQVNYERIKDAAELKVTYDGKMAVILSEHSVLLRENNDLQRSILRKQIKVEQTIDRNGVSAMVTEYIDQKERDKKT